MGQQKNTKNNRNIKQNTSLCKSEKYKKYYELFSEIEESCIYVECIIDENNKVNDFVFLEVNNAFTQITGYNKDKLIGQKLSQILPFIDKEHYKWMTTFCDNTLSSNQPVKRESYFPYFDKWFYVHSYKIKDNLLWLLMRDITPQKREMNNLKIKKISFDSILEEFTSSFSKKAFIKNADYFDKIMDLSLIKNIQQTFANTFKGFSVISNIKGEYITEISDYTGGLYNTENKSEIEKLINELNEKLNTEKSLSYLKSSEINLIVGASPIFIKDKHIANWYLGFFFLNNANDRNKLTETKITDNIENYLQLLQSISNMNSLITMNKIEQLTEEKHKKEQKKLSKLNEERIRALFNITLMGDSKSEEIENFILKKGIELTESKGGFIGFIDTYNDVIHIYNQIENINTTKEVSKKTGKIRIKKSSIWEKIIKNQKPYITNHINENILKNSFEKEQQNYIERIMVIPIIEDGNIGFIVAVNNKEISYNGADLRQLLLMVRTMWAILKLRRTEEQIQISQNEGIVLLKEVHHRVKNNFQIIKSLLNLQISSITDRKTLDVFNDVQKRIKAMSIIYEILSKSKDMSNIFVYEYVKRLYNFLLSYYKEAEIVVDTEINIDREIQINIDSAIPFGLIINEIISNSLCHAFLDEKKGKIEITLIKNFNQYTLNIKDNGIGIDSKIDFDNTSSLGLRLIRILTGQLGGKIKLDKQNGTKYKLEFQT